MSLVSQRAPPECRLFVGICPGLKESDSKRVIMEAVSNVFGQPANKLVTDYHHVPEKRCIFISFKTASDATFAFEHLSDYHITGPLDFFLRVERPHDYVHPATPTLCTPLKKTVPLTEHWSKSTVSPTSVVTKSVARTTATTTTATAQSIRQSSSSSSISDLYAHPSSSSTRSWMQKRMDGQVYSTGGKDLKSETVRSPQGEEEEEEVVLADAKQVIPCQSCETLQPKLSATEEHLKQQMDALSEVRSLLSAHVDVQYDLRQTVSTLQTQVAQMEARFGEQQRVVIESAHRIRDLSDELRTYQQTALQSEQTQRKMIDQLQIELETHRRGLQSASTHSASSMSASSMASSTEATVKSVTQRPFQWLPSSTPTKYIKVRAIDPMTITTCGQTSAFYGTVRVVVLNENDVHDKFFVVGFNDTAHAERTLEHLHAFVQRLKPSNEQTALTPFSPSDVMYVVPVPV